MPAEGAEGGRSPGWLSTIVTGAKRVISSVLFSSSEEQASEDEEEEEDGSEQDSGELLPLPISPIVSASRPLHVVSSGSSALGRSLRPVSSRRGNLYGQVVLREGLSRGSRPRVSVLTSQIRALVFEFGCSAATVGRNGGRRSI